VVSVFSATERRSKHVVSFEPIFKKGKETWNEVSFVFNVQESFVGKESIMCSLSGGAMTGRA
jgi:hypothetical protein